MSERPQNKHLKPAKPGEVRNPKGRPKGARNKLSEDFLADIQADWSEHGPSVIEAVRTEKPDQYMKVIASILPKDLNINVNKFDEMTDDDILNRLRELDAAISPFIHAEGSRGTESGVSKETKH